MSELKTYAGGCHCGKTRYEVELDLSQEVISCNCSICSKKAGLLAFAPESQFKLLSGAETESLYQWGRKVIEHRFCSVCGVSSWGAFQEPRGPRMYAVNARCLEGVDVGALKIAAFDGRGM